MNWVTPQRQRHCSFSHSQAEHHLPPGAPTGATLGAPCGSAAATLCAGAPSGVAGDNSNAAGQPVLPITEVPRAALDGFGTPGVVHSPFPQGPAATPTRLLVTWQHATKSDTNAPGKTGNHCYLQRRKLFLNIKTFYFGSTSI